MELGNKKAPLVRTPRLGTTMRGYLNLLFNKLGSNRNGKA
jgi:hypothetical protein